MTALVPELFAAPLTVKVFISHFCFLNRIEDRSFVIRICKSKQFASNCLIFGNSGPD